MIKPILRFQWVIIFFGGLVILFIYRHYYPPTPPVNPTYIDNPAYMACREKYAMIDGDIDNCEHLLTEKEVDSE